MISVKLRKTIAKRSEHTGKWSISFDVIRMRDGEEAYISAECTSGAVFDTAEQAHDGGDRAVTHFELTERFPNMCEAW